LVNGSIEMTLHFSTRAESDVEEAPFVLEGKPPKSFGDVSHRGNGCGSNLSDEFVILAKRRLSRQVIDKPHKNSCFLPALQVLETLNRHVTRSAPGS